MGIRQETAYDCLWLLMYALVRISSRLGAQTCIRSA